jgi:histidinol-phosphatase
VSDAPRPEAPSERELRELLRLAIDAARAGGRRSLEYFGSDLHPETKPDGSPVTAADRASEAAIRECIRARYPDDVIVGEEGGTNGTDRRVTWIVDPIDGTKSFIRGVPLYGVLIGVEVGGEPAVGVALLPALNELVEAAAGLGCRWNGTTAHVSSTSSLAESTLLTTSVRAVERRGVPFRRLVEATGLQRGWSDCYAHVLVATGRADIVIEPVMSVWDNAPFLPILREAGGRFTDWQGRDTIHGPDAVGSNGRLHDQVLELLRGASPTR